MTDASIAMKAPTMTPSDRKLHLHKLYLRYAKYHEVGEHLDALIANAKACREGGGFNQRFVHPVAVEQFLDKHISLSTMARENGKQIAGLKQTLDKEGIKPIFEPTGKIARFYRRSDVQRLGLA